MLDSGKPSTPNGHDATPRSVEAQRVIAAVEQATRDAVQMHKRLGNPIAIWREGKVVILQPDEIPEPS
jgi:hypothetical protein